MSNSSKSFTGKNLLLLRVCLFVAFLSAVLLPPFTLSDNLPKVELSDLLWLPVAALLLWRVFPFKSSTLIQGLRAPLLLWVGFVLVVILSITVNQRLTVLRDWFEVFKYIKFGVLVAGFAFVASTVSFIRLILWSMAALVVFNVLHYIDFADFNALVEPWYAPNIHLEYFGLDSQGQPSTRRAIGTMANPNMNGQLFVFMTFLLLLVRERFKHIGIDVLTFAALTGVMMSQSRTALIGLGVLIVFYFFAVKTKRMRALVMLASIGALYVLFTEFGNVYLSSLGSKASLESAGEGRFDQWRRIWATMPGHYLFGHAPSKEYFETHGIYSESEYFLMLFRYGFVGLTLFVATLISAATSALQNSKIKCFMVAAPVVLWMVAAITSNPLHSNKLAVVMAFTFGFVFSLVYGRQLPPESDGRRAG